MSVEENKAAIRVFIEEVFNKNKLSLIPEIFSPDFVTHVSPEYRGQDGLRQHVVETRKAFPDVRITIDHILGEGDLVAWQAALEGTNTGEFGGIAPTGKKVVHPAIAISRFAGGKEVERWQVTNSLALFQQLGIRPPV